MLIVVMADSHDNLPFIKKAVFVARQRGAETIIHCGDIVAPFAAKILVDSGIPLIAVFGNNDGEKKGLGKLIKTIVEPPLSVQISEKRFLICHELIAGFTDDADFVLYGHTHKLEERRQGRTLILNPGECGGWLTGTPTVALLETDESRVEIISLV
ncbi:MAG: metallophosphoesterase [Planctomycetota bacterium]|nr:metallophosphoesterase [Planctomycetota bacterium]